jgi:hypothetical protein
MSSFDAQSYANYRSFTHSLLIHVDGLTSELTHQLISPLLEELTTGTGRGAWKESEYSPTGSYPFFIPFIGDYPCMVRDLVIKTPGNHFGIVFIYGETLAHFRCGDFERNPFGMPFQECHPGIECFEERTVLGVHISTPFRTTWVHWSCPIHGEVQQPFSAALVNWRTPISASNHVACWSVILPPSLTL